MLHQQGKLVLHGSCVQLGRIVLSIVGTSGSGKSTLAAALCARRGQLVSDGMTPIDPITGAVVVAPARVKLAEESLRLLGHDPNTLEQVHPQSLKRYLSVEGCGGDVKLDAVLCVEDATGTDIVPLTGTAAVMKLVSNSYLAEYLPSEFGPTLLERAAALAERLPIGLLRRERKPEFLGATVQCIETFASALAVER